MESSCLVGLCPFRGRYLAGGLFTEGPDSLWKETLPVFGRLVLDTDIFQGFLWDGCLCQPLFWWFTSFFVCLLETDKPPWFFTSNLLIAI